MTDETLDRWFRKAVYAKKGTFCLWPDCNKAAQEIHHYVHRRYKVLKWDVENGIPLCLEHHAKADRLEGREVLRDVVDIEYLRQKDFYNLKEYLATRRMSRDEFRQNELEELKSIVKRN